MGHTSNATYLEVRAMRRLLAGQTASPKRPRPSPGRGPMIAILLFLLLVIIAL